MSEGEILSMPSGSKEGRKEGERKGRKENLNRMYPYDDEHPHDIEHKHESRIWKYLVFLTNGFYGSQRTNFITDTVHNGRLL